MNTTTFARHPRGAASHWNAPGRRHSMPQNPQAGTRGDTMTTSLRHTSANPDCVASPRDQRQSRLGRDRVATPGLHRANASGCRRAGSSGCGSRQRRLLSGRRREIASAGRSVIVLGRGTASAVACSTTTSADRFWRRAGGIPTQHRCTPSRTSTTSARIRPTATVTASRSSKAFVTWAGSRLRS